MKQLTKEQFIINAKQIHGNKFDYSLVEYKGCDIRVKIICPVHGIIEQTPTSHYQSDCYECGRKTSENNRRFTLENFILKSKQVHGDKYDYSKVVYKRSVDKIIIVCKEHGKFEQRASNHLLGVGCPHCKLSHGETKIRLWLTNKKIDFVQQMKFPDCKNIYVLPFDFYLPYVNTCIEYDGKQHYGEGWSKNPSNVYNEYEKIKKRDEIKTNYCKQNGIRLIRIPYTTKLTNDYLDSLLYKT